MKKLASLLLVLSCSALLAKQIPQQSFEITDEAGRKVALEYLSPDKSQCKVKLSNFHPGEKFICSSVAHGAAFSFSEQTSAAGSAEFVLDLTLENSSLLDDVVDLEGVVDGAIVKIIPLETKTPLKIALK